MSVSLFLSGCHPAANIQAKFRYISNRFARRALWMSMWWEPCSRPIQLNKIYIIPIALRLVYKSQLISHFRVAGWVTLYRLIHSQSTLSFLFSNCPSLFQFDRVQFVERAYREVSITTKLLIAWFTSTRGVYQFRTVKPVHFFRAKESLLIHLIHELCMPVSDSNHSGYIITTLCQLSEWQREDKQESKSLIIRG